MHPFIVKRGLDTNCISRFIGSKLSTYWQSLIKIKKPEKQLTQNNTID